MAYDTKLAQRIRDELGDESDVVEKKMFGGLAFMIGGRMAVCAASAGGLLVRIDPDERGRLLEREHVAPMVMREREMLGWLLIDAAGVRGKALAAWVKQGRDYARSLPPKQRGVTTRCAAGRSTRSCRRRRSGLHR